MYVATYSMYIQCTSKYKKYIIHNKYMYYAKSSPVSRSRSTYIATYFYVAMYILYIDI